ncbi:MAG: SGNH/GDSL hydrolase family protein [Planctomycetales bacterium]|nr:SGNH/GDSL hydrolase family protein [Planctomycetales bacterium]
MSVTLTTKQLSRRRKVIFRITSLCLSILAGLTGSELILRLFVEQESKRLAVYDEVLGWRGRPYGEGTYVIKADGIRVPFRYNNLGFRDEIVSPRLRFPRIMMLGDSFVESLEVPFENSFPALTENRLKKEFGSCEVVSVGSQGYSTAQELLAYRRYHPIVEPDAVMLFFYCGNDFEDNLRRNFAYLDESNDLTFPNTKEANWKIQFKHFQRWLYESSHVVFLLKNTLQSWTNLEITPQAKKVTSSGAEYQREITSQLLLRLAKEVRASGAKFSVVIIPERDRLLEGNIERPRVVAELCAAEGIDCLDLTPFLSEQHYFEHDVHFNDAGHKRTADLVVEFARKHALIGQKASGAGEGGAVQLIGQSE